MTALGMGGGVALALGLLQWDHSAVLQGRLVADRNTSVVLAPQTGRVVSVGAGTGEHVDAHHILVTLDVSGASEALTAFPPQPQPQAQDERSLKKAIEVIAGLLAAPAKLRAASLTTLGVTGDTFSLINDLYTARLELDRASEYRRLNAAHQKSQLESEIALAQRNIELLRHSLQSAKKAAQGRTAALNSKNQDFSNLLKLAEKGLVPATDVSRERDAILQAEVSEADNRKQLDQVELDISNRNLQISELRMQTENVTEDANSRVQAATLRYDLRLARLAEHKTILERSLLGAAALSEAGQAHILPIEAPVSGIVQRLGYTGPGDRVGAGTLLASVLPDGQKPVALLDVPPLAALRIHPGQKVRLSIDAYPARRFGTLEGKVERIFACDDSQRFAARVIVSEPWLRVDDVAAPLLPNFEVHAHLVLGKRRLIAALFGD